MAPYLAVTERRNNLVKTTIVNKQRLNLPLKRTASHDNEFRFIYRKQLGYAAILPNVANVCRHKLTASDLLFFAVLLKAADVELNIYRFIDFI